MLSGAAGRGSVTPMSKPVRVMVERGKKKRSVAVAFDWPGWDRSGKTEEAALEVLESYRPRYAKVAERAGLRDAFSEAGEFEVVERVAGIGMTDFYGLSGVPPRPEHDQMTDAECERKIALLEATWATLDETAARVSPELRKGPRGGGRERDEIVRHVVGWEIYDLARKVGVKRDPETREDPDGPARLPRRVRRRDPRLQRPRGDGPDLDRAVPHPPLRVAHARPRLGDGGPRPDGPS